ncbi:MAG: coenzyme F420-0:L-glutamate ligase [Sedimentisphaerales bacterium]|nr:coenzyme F420-0:L-glutamate ligase [Sedimentisphaerales bacterium]
MKKMEVLGLSGIGQIKQGDNLGEIIAKCCKEEIGGLQDRDIIVLTSKIISKAAGLTRRVSEVTPVKRALAISAKTGNGCR